MKYKLTIDQSLHNTSVGSPLSKDLKVEQPVYLILCSPRSRSPDSLFVLWNKHQLKIEAAGQYFLHHVPPVRHCCTRCSAHGLCSRTNWPAHYNIHFGNNNFPGSLRCCYIIGWNTRRRDLFILCSTASVCHVAPYAGRDQRAFRHYH